MAARGGLTLMQCLETENENNLCLLTPQGSPLLAAARLGSVMDAQRMLKSGAAVNQSSPLLATKAFLRIC